jgi:hypothetical protein
MKLLAISIGGFSSWGMGYKAVEKQVVESIETSKYKGYEPPSTKKLFPTAMNLRKQ